MEKHKPTNKVFIATSIDGYIADKNEGIDWLNSIPNPEQNDMGYHTFMNNVDALLMGRITFELVCSFDIEWPYSIPAFVLSKTLSEIPSKLKNKVEIVNGTIPEVLKLIHSKGFLSLYIDGGKTIQSFLRENLIDEMIITNIPLILGDGIPLFNSMSKTIDFSLKSSQVFLNEIVQNHYVRK